MHGLANAATVSKALRCHPFLSIPRHRCSERRHREAARRPHTARTRGPSATLCTHVAAQSPLRPATRAVRAKITELINIVRREPPTAF